MSSERKRSLPGTYATTANTLWRERRRRGLTQKEAAAAIGISLRDLRRIESGLNFPDAGLRRRLAELLGQNERELFPEIPSTVAGPRPGPKPGPRGSGNPVDAHVGTRLYQRRIEQGFSQERLAEALGVSFQQVQKYERGANRISASRLYDICRTLQVEMNYFFQEMPAEVAARSPSLVTALREEPADYEPDRGSAKESGELLGAFREIRSPLLRRNLIDLAKAIAKLDAPESMAFQEKASEKA